MASASVKLLLLWELRQGIKYHYPCKGIRNNAHKLTESDVSSRTA